MSPVPVCLLVDDPTPLVHLYRHHIHDLEPAKPGARTGDGRPLVETIPNAFLTKFCDVVVERGIKGKFSIVPAPMGRGDVVRGVEGHPAEATHAWMREARRLAPFMDFSPEMITHSYAVDLATGDPLSETEHEWSQHQTRATLEPYVARALSLLKEAGVDATGVTSPWMFGERVEAEYAAAIAAAQRRVHGRALSWYFLQFSKDPATRPRPVRVGADTVVSIVATQDDELWDTIWKIGRADRAAMLALADRYLTADGRAGGIRTVLDAGGWPALCVHWQSLFSNGHETGLAVLDEVARRVNAALGDRLEWSTCLEMARRTLTGP